MTTRELIAEALQAKSDFDFATSSLSTAVQAVQNAQDALAAANKALHDDLLPAPAGNGPALVFDDTIDPPTAVVYSAADPDTYTATPVRVAE